MAVDTPVLMYHAVWDDAVPGGRLDDLTPEERPYAISADELRRHLDLLDAAGLRCVSVRDLRALRSTERQGRIGITFDDSLPHHARVAAGVLAERGAGATFFVTVGEIGRSGRLSRSEAEALAAAGFELGGHGEEHAFYSTLGAARVRMSLAAQATFLAEVDASGEPHGLSLPGGRGLAVVRREIAATRLAYIATSEPAPWRAESAEVDEIPRFAVTPGYEATLRAIVARDAATLGAMSARYRRNERLRRLVGDRGYALLWRLLKA